MKISIVVPVYNAEKYLTECVESVINQTNPNWELILVDDGSTDNSLEICNSFAKQHPNKIFVFHKQNEGQFLTRQYGIKQCQGDYIGFLDADDFLDTGYVDAMLKVISNNQGLQVVCFGFYRWFNGVVKEVKFNEDCIFTTLSECQKVYTHIINGTLPGALWSKIFSKDLINKVYFDESIVTQKKYAEDAFQSFGIIAQAESIAYLSGMYYYYRDNVAGASQGFDNRPLYYFNTKYVFDLIEKNMPLWEMDCEEYKKQLYARNFNETVYYILKFYRSAQSWRRRHEVVKYDWSNYLLNGVLGGFENNEYIRESYLKVWKAFKRKAHLEIFIREKFRKIMGW